MCLYIQISENDKIIRTFGAQNITPKNMYGEPETADNELSTYRVCKYVDNGNGTARRAYLSGVIYHKREEGAVILSKKVLDFAISTGEVVNEP